MTKAQKYYRDNAEKIKARVRKWQAEHPERRRATRNAWRRKNPKRALEVSRQQEAKPKTRRARLIRDLARYGLTIEKFEEMLVAQDGLCAICREPDGKRKRLSVDHDHATQKVRGLLCSSCNSLLGWAGDSPAKLRAAAEYLE